MGKRWSLALFLGLSGTAWAGEVVLKAGDGEGFASFGVDEMGQNHGCGGYGIKFDPFGDQPLSQASCRSFTTLFDTAGEWRQPLANGVWSYHPVIEKGSGLECVGAERPGDVLATDADVRFDETIGGYRRHTRFVVAGHPDLEADLDQFVCGATLFQTYAFTNDGAEDVDMVVTRYFDADLDWPSWAQNVAGGVDVDKQAVRIAAYPSNVGLTIDATGDLVFEGWRGWHDPSGGASDFGRLVTQDGFYKDELNQPMRATGGPWCARTQVPGDAITDVGIGVQGTLSVPSGETRVFGTRTAMDPGKLPDASVEILGVTATPAVLPLTGDNTRVSLDVAVQGCGTCRLTAVAGSGVSWEPVGALSADVLATKSGTASFSVTCTHPGGGTTTTTTTVPVVRPKCNQGLGNGPEGCDPGNSNQGNPAHTNDEGGQPPGSPGKRGGK